MTYKDLEKQREYNHEHYVKHRKEKLEYQHEYILEHKAERIKYQRMYRAEHKAEILEYDREYHRRYRTKHPHCTRDYLNQNKVARKRGNIRNIHGRFKPYKWLKNGLKLQGFDPQIHHEWIPRTTEYTGIALVEAKDHMRNIIKPLIILEGEIVWTNETDERSKLDLHH
jgi:hypothetical protein